VTSKYCMSTSVEVEASSVEMLVVCVGREFREGTVRQ